MVVTLGGEVVRFDLSRDVSVAATKYDAIISVPDSTTASATTLWTSSSHGASSITAGTFTFLAVAPDPDETLSSSLPVNLRLTYTAASGGTTTAFTSGHRATRDAPFMLTNSLAGSPGSAFTGYITKVEAYNEDTSNDIPVRVVVLG